MKLSYLNSNFAVTLGYLNPAFNNRALVKKKKNWKMKLSIESIFLDYAESLKFPQYHKTAKIIIVIYALAGI